MEPEKSSTFKSLLIPTLQTWTSSSAQTTRPSTKGLGSRLTSKPNHCLFGGEIIIDGVGDNLLVALPGSALRKPTTPFLGFHRPARSAKDRPCFWRRVFA